MKKMLNIGCGSCNNNNYMLFNIDGKLFTICKTCGYVGELKQLHEIPVKNIVETNNKRMVR